MEEKNYTYIKIINDYKKYERENPDTWLKHCKTRKSLLEAIFYGACSKNHFKKRHPHQYKLKENELLAFAESLQAHEKMIQDCKHFDELFALVESIALNLKGIGEMVVYDATERIGLYLNLVPDKIYLHAGTKVGAQNLLGKTISAKTITKQMLPEPFKSSNLTCSQLEDILCIYKDKF